MTQAQALRLAACWTVLAPAAQARGEAGADPRAKTLSPYFFIQGGDPDVDRMPLESTRVTAQVSGVIADVRVRQTYKNGGSRPIHAVYVFPASTRAAVHGMTMTIGERVIRAQIKEKQQAKKEYERAKSEGKNASLLEQERPNVFRMSVANIMPGDRIDVELRYSELLVPTEGVYEFVYPTVVGPRYSSAPEATAPESERWIRSPYLTEGTPPASTLELSASLSAGMPIESVTSPSHKIHADWKARSEAEIALDPSESGGGNRDFVLQYRLSGGRIQSGLLLYEGSDENFFLLTVQPPKRVTRDMLPPREYVFVVDVSGSMHGFPLDVSKKLLRDLLAGLKPIDRFNVILFSGASQALSPASLPATPQNVQAATALIDSQQGGGGTELLAAVRRAMDLPHEEGGSRNIVVVTDGYIGAEREVFDHVRGNLNGANVFAFGIGSSVNRHLIEGLAKAGLGEPFVVLRPEDGPREAKRFRAYIESPVLTDIKVRYDGFDAYDVEPPSIPDVLAERPVVLIGKWRGKPSGRMTVTGVSGSGPYDQRFEAASVAPDPRHEALRMLWARTKVATLSDFSFGPETDAQRAELVSLGLKYSLLTRHTSFIAVHDVVRNVAGAQEVQQPLPLPQGVSNLAVGDEPELLLLLLAAAVLLASAWGVHRSWDRLS